MSALDSHGYQLARERLEAAARAPGDAGLLGRAGMALHAYEFRESALDLYRQAAAADPTDPQWPYLLGLTAASLGRTQLAEDSLRSAAALAEDKSFIRLRLGDALLASGQLQEALEIFDSAARGEPESMAAHLGRGSALAALGQDEAAVRALERAVAVEGGYGPLYYRLALALRSVGRVREAQGFLDLHAALGLVRRPPFADPYLRQVEELRAGSYLHHLNRAMRMEAAGRFEEAVAEYLRAIEAEPGEPHAMVNLISAYGALGRNDEAEAAYADACALNPELEEAHYNYGVVLGRRQDYTGAEAAYRRALSINPYSSDARVNLGDALEKLGQGDTAEEQYRKVLEHLPGHRLANFRLGLLLHRRGQMEQALEHFRAAVLVRDAQAARYLVVLARAERGAGRPAAATRRSREARELAVRHEQVDLLALLDREFPTSR